MASNYLNAIRKSYSATIFIAVFTNLMAFGQPLAQIMHRQGVHKESESVFTGSYVNPKADGSMPSAPTLKTSAVVPTNNAEYTVINSNYVFAAAEKLGIIGTSGETGSENPYDNFFTVKIPESVNLDNFSASLVYELYGVATASQTTKSINNSVSYGGKMVIVTNTWTPVQETVALKQLQHGDNEIYFNRRAEEMYQYKVRNLRIELQQKNGDGISITGNSLMNYNGSVYVIGTVADPAIKTVAALGRAIPVVDGVFEELFTNVPPDSKILDVTYSTGTNKKHKQSFAINNMDQRVAYEFTNSAVADISQYYHFDSTSTMPVTYSSLTIAMEGPTQSEQRDAIVVKGQNFKDIKIINDDIKNVTAGEYAGYNLKRTRLSDSTSLSLRLSYDSSKIPEGYTGADVKTFYYDKAQRSWKALATDSIDYVKHEIVSTSFQNDTDYINGVITIPESPETGSFAPTMMSDMKYADPGDGVVGVAPPSPNNTGAVATSFPIKLPPGRNGLQPSLAITYNSEGGNGVMGIGWNFTTPAISVNTKWGVPRFDPLNESELYTMDGSDLVLKAGSVYTAAHRQTGIERGAAGRLFFLRKEGSYLKIIRHGGSPSSYYWEVIDKTGNKTFYGGTPGVGINPNAVVRTPDNNIAHWAVTKIQDPYGNFIEYTYKRDSPTIATGVTAQKINIENINYTRNESGGAYYNVNFKRSAYTLGTAGTAVRSDVIVNGRNGYLQIVDDLLTEVIVSLNVNAVLTRIRGYRFDYEEKAFKKQQLIRISEYDANNQLFYTNTLDYYNDIGTGSVINSNNITWAPTDGGNDDIVSSLHNLAGSNSDIVPNGSVLGTSVSSGFSAGLRVGFGLGTNVKSTGLTVGGSGNYSVNNQETRISFIDINGDGLPDKIHKNGNNVSYRPNNGQSFGSLVLLQDLIDLSRTKSRTIGGGVDADVIYIGIGKSWSKTKSETSNYFTDFNGDGLPDVITNSTVRFNTTASANDANSRIFTTDASASANPIISGGIDPSLINDMNLESMDELREEHPQFDHVKVWKAPYSGTVKVEGSALLRSQNTYGSPNKTNHFRVLMEKAGNSQISGAAVPLGPIGNLTIVNQSVSMAANGVTVVKGDLLFFRTQNKDYGYGGEILWNPKVTYTALANVSTTDENGKSTAIYDAQQDFIMNNDGGVFVKPGDPAITLDFNLTTLSGTFTDDIRFIIKRVRHDTNDADAPETLMNTWTRTYKHLTASFDPGINPPSSIASPSIGYTYVYYFYAESNSNVNWNAINWQPKYTQNGIMSFAPINYHVYDENIHQQKYWIDASQIPNVTTTTVDQHNPLLVLSNNFFPQDLSSLLSNLDMNEFPFKVSWVVKVKNASGTKVHHTKDFWVHKINGIYSVRDDASNLITEVSHPSHYNFTFTKLQIKDIKNSGGRIFAAFYLGVRDIGIGSNNAGITVALHPSQSAVTYPGFPITLVKPFWALKGEFFGISYRGWGQFLYNGGLQFPRTPEGEIDTTLPVVNYGALGIDMGLFDFAAQSGGAQDINDQMNPDDVSGNAHAIRYAFYKEVNQNRQFVNDALFYNTSTSATYGYNSNNQLTVKLGRFAEYNLHPLYLDPAEIALGGGTVFAGLKQRSESKGSAVSGNVNIGGGGVAGTQSEATTKVLNQYVDMNGDRYPDIVTGGSIQYTNMLGGLSSFVTPNGFTAGDEGKDETKGFTIPIKPNSTKADAASAAGKTITNTSSGINDSDGRSYNTRQWTDMNGDGLPDQVRFDDWKVKVRLNLGYGFAPEMEWGANNNLNSSVRSSLSGGPSFKFTSSFAAGFGASIGDSQATALLVDVNGDGLPDLVNSDGTYHLNTGKNFTSASFGTFYTGPLEKDSTVSGNVFATGTYGFGFNIFGIPFKVVFTGTAGVNGNYSEKLRTLQDIDGDGQVDVLSKGQGLNNSQVEAQLNRVGKTHLLKKVNLPLGGSWTVDYARNGNTYDLPQNKWVMANLTTNDAFFNDDDFKPGSTATAVIYEEPKYDRREREFLGFGKVIILQKDPVNTYRKIVNYYHTENIYLSGAQKSTELYTANGVLLTRENTLYNLLNPDAPTVNPNANAGGHFLQGNMVVNAASLIDKSRLFVAVAKTEATSYEAAQGLFAIKEIQEYDTSGNLTEYIDRGVTAADAFRTNIKYAEVPLENAVALPGEITVYKNSTNELMRQREASYNAQGKLAMVTTKLNGSDTNRVSFEYDSANGNLLIVKELDNLNTAGSGHFKKTFGYDATVRTYPITISNSFGETTAITYNYLFGVPVKITDTNGQNMRTRIDDRGRVIEVTGPNEMALDTQGANAWTIRTQYKGEAALSAGMATNAYMINAGGSFLAQAVGSSSTTSQHHAVTRHFDPANTGNTIITISIADGLGQPMQVKKTHKTAGTTMRWLVSGFETKDAFWRTIKNYLPTTVAYASNPNSLSTTDTGYSNIAPTALLAPEIITYDERDRTTSITQPNPQLDFPSAVNNSTVITYTIDEGMFVQKTINERGQIQKTFTDIRGRQRKSVQNDAITTVFDYNAINELMSVTDNGGFVSSYAYDLAGRNTEIRHPDRGVEVMKYDNASRLVGQSNSNLILANAAPVEYTYNYGRLLKIAYPQSLENLVSYTYGAPGDAHAIAQNAVGRLLYQEDASGVQAFGYGRMGEMTKQLRSVAVAGHQSYWFHTTWKYDSWNRLQEIKYPDEEVVKYHYNTAGMLERVSNIVPGFAMSPDIVSSIKYTDYGERQSITYGNNTTTNYTYQNDSRRRMATLAHSFTGFSQTKTYSYDALSNITAIATATPASSLPGSGNIGGPVNHNYAYDNYNRLVHAEGNYTGPNDLTTPYLRQQYSLDMEYNTDHTIRKKTQLQTQGTVASYTSTPLNVSPVTKNSYVLDYSNYATAQFVAGPSNYGYAQPHAVRTIVETPSWVTNPASDDPRIRRKDIKYDFNGNQTEITETVGELTMSLRKNLWDEENRLKAVDLKPDDKTGRPIAIYTYNASGERVVRYNVDRSDIFSNSREVGESAANNIMIYPNGLIMAKVTGKSKETRNRILNYTKHYYIGSERISAKIGHIMNLGYYPALQLSATMSTMQPASVRNPSNTRVNEAGTAMIAVYNTFVLPPPTLAPVTEAEITGPFALDSKLLRTFHFHSDHLGSSSYITNSAGIVSQHIEYLPFGETLADEHLNSINSPFKYNGKEFDAETGNYYYGARYYDPKWSVWISVDPLAEEAPGWTPYRYGFNNPIKFIDPNGMFEEDTEYENAKTGEKVTVNDGNDKTVKVNDADFQKAKDFAQLGDLNRKNKNWNSDKYFEYKVFYEDLKYGSSFNERLSNFGNIMLDGLVGSDIADPYMDVAVIEDYGLLSGGAGAVKTIKNIKNIKKIVVIGEDMPNRVIPYAKKMGYKYFTPRSTNKANYMRNQKQWIYRQLKDVHTEIKDIGPKGKEIISKYYRAEINAIKKFLK